MTLEYAELDWRDGQPYSRIHDDVYFSSDSGLQETEHVFLRHNRLHERWPGLKDGIFTIAETGLGTGLNFLCAWQLWQKIAPKSASLHFISTEKHPLSAPDFAKSLAIWPQLGELRDLLLKEYRYLSPGWHRLHFSGRVTLTLLIGDAIETLPQLRGRVDAWFLDGFAPAKNPDMWQQSMYESMARLSHAETTFSTFTSAGDVRRGLESAGFKVSKVPGFGRKREMLCGQYAGSAHTDNRIKDKRAIVIGGGIAGTSTSHALASRGWQVQLIERHARLAQKASGNAIGVLYPRLAMHNTALSQLALSSFLYTSRLLQRLNLNQADYQTCGLLQLAFNARESARFQAIESRGLAGDLVHYVDKAQASELAGIALAHDALYFPTAGWVKPPVLCEVLARHENIQIMYSSNALKLVKNAALWQVWDEQHMLAEAPVVIIANANDAKNFEQSSHLQLQAVRGQLSFVQSTTESCKLKTVICSDGYVSPAIDGLQCIGATFSPDDTGTEIRAEDHQTNLSMLRGMAPQLHQSLHSQALTGRVALRCATSDYLPVVGPLLDSRAMTARPPRPNVQLGELPWLQGLYMNAGHGSKGLITAPLCAEILASAICAEPSPVDSKLLLALDPNRFLLKKLGLKRLLRGNSS